MLKDGLRKRFYFRKRFRIHYVSSCALLQY